MIMTNPTNFQKISKKRLQCSCSQTSTFLYKSDLIIKKGGFRALKEMYGVELFSRRIICLSFNGMVPRLCRDFNFIFMIFLHSSLTPPFTFGQFTPVSKSTELRNFSGQDIFFRLSVNRKLSNMCRNAFQNKAQHNRCYFSSMTCK